MIVIYIFLLGQPKIIISPETNTIVSGCETFFATCVAVGTELNTITFSRDGSILSANDQANIVVEVEDDVTTNTVTAILQLGTVTQDDAGIYSCSANSAVGFDDATFSVSVPNAGKQKC